MLLVHILVQHAQRNIHQRQQLTATDTIQRVAQLVQQHLLRVCKDDIILLELSVKKSPISGDFFYIGISSHFSTGAFVVHDVLRLLWNHDVEPVVLQSWVIVVVQI